MKKRICIVFEETNEIGITDAGLGPRFNVYLEGQDTKRLRSLPEKDWTPAEFWAVKCFNIVIASIQEAGAIEGIKKKID